MKVKDGSDERHDDLRADAHRRRQAGDDRRSQLRQADRGADAEALRLRGNGDTQINYMSRFRSSASSYRRHLAAPRGRRQTPRHDDVGRLLCAPYFPTRATQTRRRSSRDISSSSAIATAARCKPAARSASPGPSRRASARARRSEMRLIRTGAQQPALGDRQLEVRHGVVEPTGEQRADAERVGDRAERADADRVYEPASASGAAAARSPPPARRPRARRSHGSASPARSRTSIARQSREPSRRNSASAASAASGRPAWRGPSDEPDPRRQPGDRA